jgi:hypothetical protein
MYAVLGVPAAVIWAGATFIVALIPIFGTFMVWGPAPLIHADYGGRRCAVPALQGIPDAMGYAINDKN